MWDHHMAGTLRMLEFHMVALAADADPAFGFKPFDQFEACQVV
jgi:hypothetical protein